MNVALTRDEHQLLNMFAFLLCWSINFLVYYIDVTYAMVWAHVLRWPKQELLFVTLHYYFLLTNYYYEFELYYVDVVIDVE